LRSDHENPICQDVASTACQNSDGNDSILVRLIADTKAITPIAEIYGGINMRTVTVLCVAILATASAAAADSPAANSDKAAIQSLETTYNEGLNSKDVGKIMSVYAPGKQLFVFDVVPPREYTSWEAYKKDWEELFAAFPGPIKNTMSEQTIHVVGSLAYGHSIQTGEFTRKDGTKMLIAARTTDVYRKMNGKWLIVEEHNSVPVDLEAMKPDLLSKP
jgi:ketosteroid isomerase-like protein